MIKKKAKQKTKPSISTKPGAVPGPGPVGKDRAGAALGHRPCSCKGREGVAACGGLSSAAVCFCSGLTLSKAQSPPGELHRHLWADTFAPQNTGDKPWHRTFSLPRGRKESISVVAPGVCKTKQTADRNSSSRVFYEHISCLSPSPGLQRAFPETQLIKALGC